MSGIDYRTDMAGVTASMADGMFVGWPEPPSPQQLLEVMAASHRHVWALGDGRVVGFICAISDGVLNASIPWLEVRPDFQNRGIGRELVRRLLAQLDDMYAVDLVCDPDLLPWYESLGFSRCSAAVIRNRPAIAAQRAPASRGDTVVRPLRPGDAGAVLDAFACADDMARQGGVHDLPSAQQYVSLLTDADHRAYVAEQTGRLAALVALQLDRPNRSAWVSYWAHPRHRGAGITSSLVATVADWAIRDLGLERLELGYRADNPASACVAAAAGFVVEGRERGKFLVGDERVDVLTAARLASDPAPRTPLLPMRHQR